MGYSWTTTPRPRASRGLPGVLPIMAVVLVVALAPSAQAKDMNGRLGVGVEASLGGTSGISVRYWPGNAFGLLFTLGADVLTVEKVTTGTDPDTGEPTETSNTGLATTAGLSTGFTYNFARSTHANLGVGARLAVSYESREAVRLSDPDADAQRFQFKIELPLMAEFFLSDSFSVSVATGILLDFGNVTIREDANTTTSTTFRVGIGSSSVTGTIGIVYYF